MFDIEGAVAVLAAEPARAAQIAGMPLSEGSRSVVAARVTRWAAAEGLRLFHFEHRALLEVPVPWQTSADDAALPEWVSGVLAEPKYGAFRHDQGIGSFHPGHRAKWSTHELCHGLVGTAWHPDATPLFHATAGRLAELVPVVLWYFLDEIGLVRCPRHRGPLYRSFCSACEACAAAGTVDPVVARRWLNGAVDYVLGELDAVDETLRLGVPVHHVHGSLDLCSDGLAYAAAHGPRLSHPGTAAWAERYLRPQTGGVSSIEALRERVCAVFTALAAGEALAPRGGTADAWVAQDLSGRVLQGLYGDAEACEPVWDALDAADLETAIRTYAELSDRLGAQHPADVFAPGYLLAPGVGLAVDQIDAGLRTVLPMVMQLADDVELDLAEAFCATDRPERRPLGLRMADRLPQLAVPHVAALGRYEAGLRAAAGQPDLVALGVGQGACWADGVQRWQGDFDPIEYGEAVDAGQIEGQMDDGLLSSEAPESVATQLTMGRSADGELILVHGDPAEAQAELLALGLMRPERWQA